MKKLLPALMGVIILSISLFAQPPDTLWTSTYGGSDLDRGWSVQQTTDGGFIVAGNTRSYGVGVDDFYLIKTNSAGNTLWTRTYGGASWDVIGRSVEQTTDGGYIIVGRTMSYGAGGYDVYLVKTNSAGDALWTRTYGGSSSDYGQCARQTTDGGYIVAGYTNSYGAGGYDVYLIKTDSTGDTLWTRTYGGYSSDFAQSVRQTIDGGYIIAGNTQSYGAGGADVYLIKTNSNGDTLWTHTYGGSGTEFCASVQQTTDEGYICAGYSGPYAGYDFYLVKTNSTGDTLWTRTYGGSSPDHGEGVQQTTDGGYIMAGETQSYGAGGNDVYLVKTNSTGDTLWTRTYGGSGMNDFCRYVQQTADGGYILAGHTDSFGAGDDDVYLIRIEGDVPPINLTLTPHNPPIQIPAGGGSFTFDALIENTTAGTVNFDVWTFAISPNGIEYPLIVRPGLSLPAGDIIERELTQFVPPAAFPGIYIYIGIVGVYPDSTTDLDSFPFEKLPGYDASNHDYGWSVYGWDGEESPIISTPSEFSLYAPYPNPFNPMTNLSFSLPEAVEVSLIVYDIQGREVARLIDGWRSAGVYEATFNGSELASGVYFAHLTAGNFQQTRKLLLVK